MPPKPKQDSQEAKVDKLAQLRSEIIDILEEYLDELNRRAEELPGEHNIEPIRNAQYALHIFKPT